MYWQNFTWDTKNLPIGMINQCKWRQLLNQDLQALIHYFYKDIGLEKISPFYTDLMKAYEAPFLIRHIKWVQEQCLAMSQ